MLDALLGTLPRWVLAGLALGALFAAIVAAVFAVGSRAFGGTGDHAGVGTDGGEARRREEIRRYLRAIGEPFRENHTVEGHEVAFFLPDRDVAITFDPRTYFGLGRTGVHPILAEHELPGAGLGTRLPFETPEIAPDTDDGVDAACAVLGVSPDASEAELRAAYREQVKEVHPDHGGDPEAFKRVRDAYDTARTGAD